MEKNIGMKRMKRSNENEGKERKIMVRREKKESHHQKRKEEERGK